MNSKLFRPNVQKKSDKTEENSMGNQKYLSVLFVIKGRLYSYFTQKYFKWSCRTQ